MAKDKKWDGVNLLSFDLQTVEFAYAAVSLTLLVAYARRLHGPQDYSVSISCTDQLSPTGGSFDLRFSRCPHAPWIKDPKHPNVDNGDLFNPHDDAEPYMRHVLRHGRLAPSVHRLVGLLRDTLPIVAELEDMRLQGERDGANLDTFAKAAGWYRLLYGDLRCALYTHMQSVFLLLIGLHMLQTRSRLPVNDRAKGCYSRCLTLNFPYRQSPVFIDKPQRQKGNAIPFKKRQPGSSAGSKYAGFAGHSWFRRDYPRCNPRCYIH